jgi:hypothetical protein
MLPTQTNLACTKYLHTLKMTRLHKSTEQLLPQEKSEKDITNPGNYHSSRMIPCWNKELSSNTLQQDIFLITLTEQMSGNNVSWPSPVTIKESESPLVLLEGLLSEDQGCI